MAVDALTIVSAISLLLVLACAGALAQGKHSIRELRQVSVDARPPRPSVSIVFAARDEEERLPQALSSLLSQDYPDYEVVAVDDRSRDASGRILRRLAESDARLRVVEIEHLPQGWLGKTHALHRGVEVSRGEILLFTDADVHLAPDVLSRAVSHLLAERLDHLTIGPDFRSGNATRSVLSQALLQTSCLAFGLAFSLLTKPWLARRSGSKRSVGIGAFNMALKESYLRAGGHRSVALCVDDDLALGRRLKESGGRQEALSGRGMVSLEWYSNVGEMSRGLTKNAFAALGYSLLRVVYGSLLMILAFLWPWTGLFLTSGVSRGLSLVGAVVWSAIYLAMLRYFGRPWWWAILFPLSFLFLGYVMWRSTILTLWRGGVLWRGRRYPLRELRRFSRQASDEPRNGR